VKKLAVIALALSLLPAVAQAGIITVDFTGGPALTVTYGGSGGSGGTPIGTRAGDMLITNSTTDPVLGIPSSFYTFCVDLQHYASSPNLATVASMNSWDLFAGVETYQRLGASYLANQYFAMYPTGASDAVAANYQVAIWEVLYERERDTAVFNNWTVAGGSTYFGSFDTTGAQALIRGINTTSPYYRYAGVLETMGLQGVDAQNFVAPVPDGGATLTLLGGALLGLGTLRRKFGR
jgi:hypothetical protein